MKVSKLVAAAALASAFISGGAEADHLTASLTIDPDASRTPDRLAVIVTGSYSCDGIVEDNPGNDVAFIQIDVSQAAGQSITRGIAGSAAHCDGTLQTFEIQVPADNRPWKGGRARAHGLLFVQDCDIFGQCENTTAEAASTVRLGGGTGS
jgi:hypothetical protein